MLNGMFAWRRKRKDAGEGPAFGHDVRMRLTRGWLTTMRHIADVRTDVDQGKGDRVLPKLEFSGVHQVYDGTRGATNALGPFDLKIHSGEAVAVLGPSGCGKSTSLLLASGLLRPTEGSVLVDGTAVSSPRLETGLILQDFGLMPWKTVEQNAGLGLQVRRIPRRERRERTKEALERVSLSEFAGAYPSELSGGMRQRLAMARVLACDIDLLLMDEPLSALDALLREEMQNMLKRTWRENGYAQVLVTHSIEEAVFLGQRVVVLSPRPGCIVRVLDNLEMDADDWRDDPLFFERCRMLRETLREGANASASSEREGGFHA